MLLNHLYPRGILSLSLRSLKFISLLKRQQLFFFFKRFFLTLHRIKYLVIPMAENLNKSTNKDDVSMGSNKSFGIVFAIVFLIIALWPLTGGGEIRLWSLSISCVFIGLAFLAPDLLTRLNIIWFKFGLLLHKIVSPIMMGLVYVLTIIPIGLILRLAGKDPMRMKKQDNVNSYWIKRDVVGPDADSFKNQF